MDEDKPRMFLFKQIGSRLKWANTSTKGNKNIKGKALGWH